MKIRTLLSTTLLTLLCVGPVLAEPAEGESPEAGQPFDAQTLAATKAAAETQRQVARRLKETEYRVLAQNTGGGSGGQSFSTAGPGAPGGSQVRRAFSASFSTTPEPPLIVVTTALEPKAAAELREDLLVMGKLVSDALTDDPEDSSLHRAMGILVRSFPGGGNNTLYVEGSGAIIQASVRVPLLPGKKDEAKAGGEPAKKSAWESARREIYGGKKDDGGDVVYIPERREEYSAERVEGLKKSILKAMANANNFRHLTAKETVTVVVRNRSGRSDFLALPVNDLTRPPRVGNDNDSDATMTVRVKKSDADALAAGKINEEEFQKRAQIAIY